MDAEAALIWADPDTPALCLLTLGVDRNPETEPSGDSKRVLCLNWGLDTWVDELTAENGSKPHPVAVARLGAALGLLSNPDDFYCSVAGFHDVVEGLSGDWFDTATNNPTNTDEIARTLAEAFLISPPEPDEKFSPSVVRYVNMVARNDGFDKLPNSITAFGITQDQGVDWGPDLSGDPDLAAVAVSGAEDRGNELAASLRDYLLELADKLDRLPLRHLNSRAVAEQIRYHVSSEPSPE
jgi:hypothetical protein